MATIGELKVMYSGGSANVDQAMSIGGGISLAAAASVISQIAGTPSPLIAGLSVLDARGHVAYGAGTLRWVNSSGQLLWRRPGGATFIGVPVVGNGIYTLGDSSGYLIVEVTATLPAATIDSSINISPATNRTFDNISPAQSLSGYADYRCFYLRNTAATGTAIDVKLWIKKQPDGADILQIALDPSGLNGTALQLLNEEDTTGVLSAISWSAPITQSGALVLGNLAPGAYRAFWVKRTVPPDTYVQVLENRSSLAFSALV